MVEIKLDISKRFLVFTSFLFAGLFLISFSFANSGQFNLPLPWVIDSNGNSVDSNNNGKVDDSDKLEGLSASDLAAATGTSGTNGKVFPIVIGSNTGSCPSGYDYFSYNQVKGSTGNLYLTIDQDHMFFGAVNSWYKGFVAYQSRDDRYHNNGFCIKFIVA